MNLVFLLKNLVQIYFLTVLWNIDSPNFRVSIDSSIDLPSAAEPVSILE